MAIATEINQKTPDDETIVSIDCKGVLDDGELLDSITSVIELITSDLTISATAINILPLIINGRVVPVGEALQCLIADGVAGETYKVTAKVVTNSIPAQKRNITFKIKVVDDDK